jgi:hypothetical protein
MRGRTLCRSLILLAGIVGAAALSVPSWPQETIDPQSLVGVWTGSWTNRQWSGRSAGGTGDYKLTIERVEGSQVYGRGTFYGPKGTNEFDVVGTLEGNQLTYGKKFVTKLLIRKGEMTGSSEGQITRDITLYKKK